MRLVFLTQKKVALIDDDDWELVKQFKWRTQKIERKGVIYRYYAITGQKDEATLMHRLVMGLGRGDKIDIDHVDGDGLNNQKYNLREASRSQNVHSQKLRPHSSRFTGVSWQSIANKWIAQIHYERKVVYLGLYEEEEEAAAAYNLAALTLFGEFARLNNLEGL